MSPEFTCQPCRVSWEMDAESAMDRLELTTVRKPDRTQRAFVCPRCGRLLEPIVKTVYDG